MGNASEPVMRFVSNAELDEQEAEEPSNDAYLTGLAGHVQKCWEEAKNAKQTAVDAQSLSVEEMILQDYRQRNGKYDPDKLAQIKDHGGSDIYMMLTSMKCRAAEAWITDVMMPAEGKNWVAKPTPISDLSPEDDVAARERVWNEFLLATQAGIVIDREAVTERLEQVQDEIRKELQERAEQMALGMERKIEDQMVEGGWEDAFRECIMDIISTKAGFIEGPTLRNKERLMWTPSGPQVTKEPVIEFRRLSPLDVYPSPNASDIDDDFLIIRERITPSALSDLRGLGYDDEAISKILEEKNSLSEWLFSDQEREEIEQKSTNFNGLIDCLRFHGRIKGEMLNEWNDKLMLDDDEFHEVTVWYIKGKVIKAAINEHPLKKRNITKASYEYIPGSFWGRGVPEIMRDIQTACNAIARAIVNNSGIASGPQVAVNDVDRLPPGEDITALYPWKIWQFNSDHTATAHRPPIEFYQPQLHVEELLRVYEYFSKLADEYTGIPAYTYGSSNIGGAGRTSSGLSMLLNQAARGIKHVISHIDRGIIERNVQALYVHNMLYDEDDSIKGDINIEAIGAKSLVAKEQQQMRRTEMLQATNNPTDLQIMGLGGRAKLLDETFKVLDMHGMVPDEETIKARELMMQMQQMQQQPRTQDVAGNPSGGEENNQFQ